MPDQARCRSCGAAIIWAKTEKGKSAPYDAEPVEDGSVMLSGGDAFHLHPDQVRLSKEKGVPLHKSHFATCPNAKQHRKPKESTDAQPG